MLLKGIHFQHPMACSRCSAESSVETRTGAYCRSCFRRLIEKRVRAHIRRTRPFSIKGSVYCEDDLSKALLERIFGHSPLRMVDSPEGAVVLKHRTMDDENAAAIKAIFDGERVPLPSSSVLSCLTDEEALQYAGMIGVAFTPNERDPEVERFMATVAARYPDTPYSLKRSIDFFREHLANPADDDDKAL